MDLFVRATRSDHTVIEHFLTPPAAGIFTRSRPPIAAVVTDSTVASSRPQLARITRDSGAPYLIDPLTPLFQSEQAPGDNWAQLPYAYPEATQIGDLSDYVMDEIIDRVVSFQRERGATHLIPPYFYSTKRGDAWWHANLAILRRTGGYLRRHNIDSPLVPVLAASLREYGPAVTWADGLDTYLQATNEMNTETVALSWSWNNPTQSKDAALALLLGATEHAASMANVVGWRAGTFGLAMTAVGAGGYETGMGAREYLHYPALANSHKPKPSGSSSNPRQQAYVYLSPFGRSVPREAGAVLLNDPRLVGSLMCGPESGCCPDGVEGMTRDWRQHLVRERRRELDQLEAMPPSVSWRLHSIERKAERAHDLALAANEVLDGAGVKLRVPAHTMASLAKVAGQLRSQRSSRAA